MSKCTSRASMRCTYLGQRASRPPTICGTLGEEDRAASILVTLIGCHSPVHGHNAQYHPANFQVRKHRVKVNENSAVILSLRT